MINSFNAKVATQFGVNIALFIQYISQRTFTNLSQSRHIHDGLCWTYNTIESLLDIFPYFSTRQLRTIIENCVDLNLLKKGNYNKVGYDRTTWFALTPEAMKFYPELVVEKYLLLLIGSENTEEPASVAICQKWQMDLSELTNRFDGNDKTIPTNITTKLDISKDISKIACTSLPPKQGELTIQDLLADNKHEIPEQMLVDWISIRKQKKSKITRTAWCRMNRIMELINTQLKILPVEAFETMVMNCWQSLDVKYFKPQASTNTLSSKRYGGGSLSDGEISWI